MDLGSLASSIKGWFSLKGRHWWALTLMLLLVLFMPDSWAEFLGVHEWRLQFKTYLGLGLVVSLVMSVVSVLEWAWKRFQWMRMDRAMRESLHKLSPQEKSILCGYIFADRKTQYFSPMDGVVNGLEQAKVVYLSSQLGTAHRMPYNIQPWAWDYLVKHQDLILNGAPRDEQGNIIIYGDSEHTIRVFEQG